MNVHLNFPVCRKIQIITLSLLSLWSLCTQAQVTWQFNYLDDGVGFDDPTHGADRRAALNQAASELSQYFVNYTATIDIDVVGNEPNFLASAGSRFNGPVPTGFSTQGDVMIKILGGADPNPSVSDGYVNWNFADADWELGNDFQAGEYDFNAVVKHELMHALGFFSLISEDGTDTFFNTPVGSAGVWSPYDQWISDENGALINESFELDSVAWNAASVGGSGEGGLQFIGPNAMAANGDNPLYLYSPSTWVQGSSGSHLDTAFYNSTYLMEHSGSPGPNFRELSAVEIGMLKDIGYTQVIPEVDTLFMMGASLAAIFLVCRVSRK